jgi:signal transduction histidine kinase
MADVVRLSVSSVDAFAQQKQIEVIADQPAVEVMGDEDRLIQVLVNLLSNAIKFSPKGAKVSVNYRIVEGACEIRVKDDGPGIPADNVDSVFERFKQLDTTRAQHKSGSGLGLAICKEIVQAHGGKIGVDSQIGKGSVFWFRVPLAPVNEEADSNAQSKLEGQHRK